MTSKKQILITGGAGFIGSQLARHNLRKGNLVTVYDNLSRAGTEHNVQWLKESKYADNLQLLINDLRDYSTLKEAVKGADIIFHMGGQVAVTGSVTNPRLDFEVNALGTFNLLEAIRETGNQAILIYASTNKVYGGMEDVVILEDDKRYRYKDFPEGIPESFPLDFHSPYGCSKGAADQYVRDYARIYGVRSIVFRQSCIYGTRQFGNEDQGWVAHFVIAAALNRPITIYGDGKQVRDVLFIEDLLNAFDLAMEHIDVTAGQVYNIGGGNKSSISIWAEFGELLAELAGHKMQISSSEWRPGDQKIYVSDTGKAKQDFGWEPKIPIIEGIQRLYCWVAENRHLFN